MSCMNSKRMIYRPTVAKVNLGAIASNTAKIRERVGKRTKIMAVVKADAYGHGAIPVSKVLVDCGIDYLGVATLEEAVELRQNGIVCPILVMGIVSPSLAEVFLQFDLTATVSSLDIVQALFSTALIHRRRVKVHLKVDTGLGRIGVSPKDALLLAKEICSTFSSGIQLEGIFTHLAEAERSGSSFTKSQILKFQSLLRELELAGVDIPLKHMANSAAILNHPSTYDFCNMVRPGILIYGVYPSEEDRRQGVLSVERAISLHTAICYLKRVPQGTPIGYGCTYITRRESVIATLPIGYADGYKRELGNVGEVLIRGKRAPIVGNACMDMVMVNVTDIPNPRLGEEVVVIGRQGTDEISVEEIARKCNTVCHAVVVGIGRRVPRTYYWE